jgi:uncharacterized membrane protein YgaE (UPF0421/DUF939 family)
VKRTEVIVDQDRAARRRARGRPVLVPTLTSLRTRSDLSQVLKAVLAAVLAWLVAAHVLGLQESFMAPWTALLTVHATVFRSFTRGGQVMIASLAGILLSYVAVEVVGQTPTALGLALLVGMLLGRVRPIRDEGSTVATTALFVITAGQAEQAPVLLDRVVCTGLGVALGILVNLLVLAPLDDRLARDQVDALRTELGELLYEMADALTTAKNVDPAAWLERTLRAEEQVGEARGLLRHTREARRGNPRKRSREIDPAAYENFLRRIDEGFTQARSMARTVENSHIEPDNWDPHFRDVWLRLLHDLGARITAPAKDQPSLLPRLQALTDEMSREDLPQVAWPVYGALINSTRTIVEIVDEVLNGPLAGATRAG